MLTAAGLNVVPVTAQLWKRDLGLWQLTKDDSRELARICFPSRTSDLRRKKDHGRAEALLLAAWGHGVRFPLGQLR